MNILITGSSGLIGSALSRALVQKGHVVYPMVRKDKSSQPFYWQPTLQKIHLDESIVIDAVVNLAGASIAKGRWNADRKNEILRSRVDSTSLLCEALAKLRNPPRILISGSAIGFYGDTGSTAVDESSEAGSDYLSSVAMRWENAAKPASDAGIRTVNIRTGVVLSTDSGALAQMLLPFKMGLGGIVGNGRQYWSWISIDDVVEIIQFVIDEASLTGPVNMVAPAPVTNYAFTKSLGNALNRPTIFPLPAFMARLLFGEMADALLMGSVRVVPAKLQQAGYKFIHTDLDSALMHIVSNGGRD